MISVTQLTTALHATSLVSCHKLKVGLYQVDRYLDLKERVFLSAACIPRRYRLWNRELLWGFFTRVNLGSREI